MSTLSVLTNMNKLCYKLNQTNQTKEKIAELQKVRDPLLIQLLVYTYDPSIVFNVTSKNIKKFIQKESPLKANPVCVPDHLHHDDVFYVLDQLKDSNWTGNKALEMIKVFLQNKEDDQVSLFYNIIDKNLKIRISLATLQRVFPEKFEEFPVVLANSYSSLQQKVGSDDDDVWFISRKLDGMRCLVMINVDNNNNKNKNKGTVSIYSRNKKPIHTLDYLRHELMTAIQHGVFSSIASSFVLDGEIIDNFEKDSFKTVMENITKKDHTMNNFEYRIFDCIPLSQFKKKNDPKTAERFSVRYHKIRKVLEEQQDHFHYCKILDQIPYSEESIKELEQEAQTHSWEGLMLRKDTVYEGKRTNSLLKKKTMHDDEFLCVDVEIKPFRIIDKKDKIEKTIECLSNITIQYTPETTVNVGSGFTLEERIKYYENPDAILNKKVTVQYFEKTEKSLRFPVFKGIRCEE